MATVNFRKVRPDEIDSLREKFASQFPWAAEPAWGSVYVLEDNGKIGFFGLEVRVVVEPLYSESPAITRSLIDRVDTMLFSQGVKMYEFVVPHSNQAFQQTLENHYGLQGEQEIPHLIYFVKRDQLGQV